MSRRPVQARPMPKERDELAFPVPYGEQARYLQLADHFLALDLKAENKVVSICEGVGMQKTGFKDAA